MKVIELDKEAYFALLEGLSIPKEVDKDFIYEIYSSIIEGAKDFEKQYPVMKQVGINPAELTLYIVNEHIFSMQLQKGKKSQEDLINDDKYAQLLESISLDKYFTNEHLAYQMGSMSSKFHPSISTMELYLNFMLGMLSRFEMGNPRRTLIVDVLNSVFKISKCVCSLLQEGFQTEAFSTWRTLHENECILSILVKYGEPVIDKYLTHMRYSMAFRGGLGNKEETDNCFLKIKEEMKKLDLKSKDMKKFIEYGWLTGVPEYEKIEGFKFNFRDGVERIAGLNSYSKVYEMSSEIAHSSPLLIYSRKEYFHLFTLLNLYESFFRLEKISYSLYAQFVSEQELRDYNRMKSIYYSELIGVYEYHKRIFQTLYKKD